MNAIAPESRLETRRLLLKPLVPVHARAIYEQLLDLRLYQFILQELGLENFRHAGSFSDRKQRNCYAKWYEKQIEVP